MSSSLGFLAYVLREPEAESATCIRLDHVQRHLAKLYRGALTRTSVGDSKSGFVGFSPADAAISWDRYSVREGAGLAWLHVPSLAGKPEDGVDEWALADAVFSGSIKPIELGGPFAVVRWSAGQIEIMNDVLGLVRLFHYEFDGGDVWSTRMGLAHVFLGETPKRNQLAWAGMATIGWALGGSTQLGSGQQLPAGSRVRAGFGEAGRHVQTECSVGEWLDAARSGPEPAVTTIVQDMEQLMSSAKRWPVAAVSDLSGGKDSRVIAAMGIRSGSIEAVRTIATDHGEVETAQTLMASIDTEVEHRIVPKTNNLSSSPGANVIERLTSQHAAFEGRFLAATAFNGPAFGGFRASAQAHFNGLGGEVMNGGSFTRGPWRQKLEGAPIGAAGDRMVTMIKGLGASDDAKAEVEAFAEAYPRKMADASGINSASGILDLFYNMDRMPNWSNVFAGADTLCPLFASGILIVGARNIGSPVPDGELHTKLLAEAIPQWAGVPFYKPVGLAKRALPMAWENPNWSDVRQFMLENVDRLEAFSRDGITSLLADVEAGTGVKSHEVAVQRFLWNATFRSYEESIAAAAREVRLALSEAKRAFDIQPADPHDGQTD